MDSFYTGPDLFHNLLTDDQTPAGGTVEPRPGVPKEHTTAKLKQRIKYKVMSYNHKLIGMRHHDQRHVTLLSISYSSRSVNTGRKHCQNKGTNIQTRNVHVYNKFMVGLDLNDQLLKYSAFSRRNLTWWKKVIFRLMNIASCKCNKSYHF